MSSDTQETGVFDSKHTSCVNCWSPAKHRCSRCRRATYCSVKCQRGHWNQGHSEWCSRPMENHIHGVPVARVYDALVACCSILGLYYHEQRTDKASPFHPRTDPSTDQFMVTDSFQLRDPMVWDIASIGSGLAMAEYALLMEHQSRTQRTARLRFVLVDPAPTSWTYGCGVSIKHPVLQPTHKSVDDVAPCDSWRLRDVMLINYCDGRPYDLLAVCAHKPRMLLSIVELSGAAGSSLFHKLLSDSGRPTKVSLGGDAESNQIASMLSMMGIAYVHLHHHEILHRQSHPRIQDTCIVQVNALRVLTLRGMQRKFDDVQGVDKASYDEIRLLLGRLNTSSHVAAECADWPPDRVEKNNQQYQFKLQAVDAEQASHSALYWQNAGFPTKADA